MDAIVIYESLTGKTKRAGELIADALSANGVPTVACSVTAIDYQALQRAGLVIVGSWTDGLVFVGQKPGRQGRIRALPSLGGKKAVVYLTYAIDSGKALEKLSATVNDLGADVLGGQTIRRDRIPEGVADFVDGVLAAVTPA